MNESAGDYKLLTQQLTGSQEAVVVVDAAAQRVILYGFDYSRRQLLPLDGFELERLQRPAADEGVVPPAAQPKP